VGTPTLSGLLVDCAMFVGREQEWCGEEVKKDLCEKLGREPQTLPYLPYSKHAAIAEPTNSLSDLGLSC